MTREASSCCGGRTVHATEGPLLCASLAAIGVRLSAQVHVCADELGMSPWLLQARLENLGHRDGDARFGFWLGSCRIDRNPSATQSDPASFGLNREGILQEDFRACSSVFTVLDGQTR